MIAAAAAAAVGVQVVVVAMVWRSCMVSDAAHVSRRWTLSSGSFVFVQLA